MLERTSRIKNLAIALEALYRTPATSATYEVERQIEYEIKKYKEETADRPIEPIKPEPDDEIPF